MIYLKRFLFIFIHLNVMDESFTRHLLTVFGGSVLRAKSGKQIASLQHSKMQNMDLMNQLRGVQVGEMVSSCLTVILRRRMS